LFNAYGELIGIVVGGISDGANTIDMIINADHLGDLTESPTEIMSRDEYFAFMNLPEEDKYTVADSIAAAQAGELVRFGKYEQDNDIDNGCEDIYWLVLDKNENGLMLTSLYCLDAMPYHDAEEPVTWETSSIRRFLNNEFYNSAFTDDEQAIIVTTTVVNNSNPVHGTEGGNDTQDKVYLLSIEEVMHYFNIPEPAEMFYDHLYAVATEYAAGKGVWLELEHSKRCWWWMRSPGGNDMNASEAGSAGYFSLNGSIATCTERGVRPVIWVKV